MLWKICDSYWADLSALSEVGVVTVDCTPKLQKYSVDFVVSGVAHSKIFDTLEEANKFAEELVQRVNSVD